jgi:hypothetical protein
MSNKVNETPALPGFETLFKQLVKPFRFAAAPHEYKVIALKECLSPDATQLCDTPQAVALALTRIDPGMLTKTDPPGPIKGCRLVVVFRRLNLSLTLNTWLRCDCAGHHNL